MGHTFVVVGHSECRLQTLIMCEKEGRTNSPSYYGYGEKLVCSSYVFRL